MFQSAELHKVFAASSASSERSPFLQLDMCSDGLFAKLFTMSLKPFEELST
jgi:hypothetical protein